MSEIISFKFSTFGYKIENMAFKAEEKYMQRAIELARLGMGHVAPNPMVGCVVVHNNRIIGEGYHQIYGEAHAEVNAIASVADQSLLKDSTLYVTLEPCAHYGKTPPCAELIVEKQIPRVVVGTIDSFAKVSGRGVEIMETAGVDVLVSFLDEQCKELNRRFFTFHGKKRPYVILKWAQTLDGFIDIDRTPEEFGEPTWITNALSKMAVHKTRIDESAIMVATNTVVKDNPSLSAREWSNGEHPVRVVLDRLGRIPDSANVLDGSIPTLVFTEKELESRKNVTFIRASFNETILTQVLSELHSRDIQSLIVEGGSQLLTSFLSLGLWDEARVFLGNRLFRAGVKAPAVPSKLYSRDDLNDSQLLIFRNE